MLEFLVCTLSSYWTKGLSSQIVRSFLPLHFERNPISSL